MIRLEDLTNIPEREAIKHCLDFLLTRRDEEGFVDPIITGYNYYSPIPQASRVIIFSHMYETKNYKEDMLKDLETMSYSKEDIDENIREKLAIFLWSPKFLIRNEEGVIYNSLRIRDTRTGKFIDLERFKLCLGEREEYSTSFSYLIGESQGWQLDMPLSSKKELFNLIRLFLKRSGKDLYYNQGLVIPETEEEKDIRSPWKGAYETPVLLLGESVLGYSNELAQFSPITRFILNKNSNEASFVIHRNLRRLVQLPQYKELINFGFIEEKCLGNNAFIKEYVDKKPE